METYVLVEGESDRYAAWRLLAHVGIPVDVKEIALARGVDPLDKRLRRLNSGNPPFFVVCFRDADGKCPVDIRKSLLGERPHDGKMELRIAVSMMEAWLLADHVGFSDYFKVSEKKISPDPDSLPHAKKHLLSLCRKSRSRRVREDVVASTRDLEPGPLYSPRINEFAETAWCIERACERSPSLRRTVERLTGLVER